MIMKKYGLIIILVLSSLYMDVKAEDNVYNANILADNLIENAKAVVRLDEVIFKINSIGKAIKSVKYAVTILNKNGDDYANFIAYYDKLRILNNLKICIYDQDGELIKKVKKADIEDYSAASGYSLYEDNRVKHYKPLVNSYPYTIKYEYDLIYDGLLHYPTWYPISAYDLSVEKSSFKIMIPVDMEFRYKESNIIDEMETNVEKGFKTYAWSVKNMPALEKEPYSPYLYEFTPVVYTAPNEFEVEGFKGKMTSWKLLGDWQNQLNSGLDELPLETLRNLRGLVSDEMSDILKTQKVYEYLQGKTRYVNIAEGIGGWRPFPASTVEEVGYGDCKALSNYMHAMLKSIGIESYYTLVKAGNDRNMNSDFPSRQSNHIIICVPLANDTVWLECTNQNIPFGYLGDFTDDRDVILITKDGGKIAHTITYNQNENTQFRKAKVEIDGYGGGKASVLTVYGGLQYDNVSSLLNAEREDQKASLRKSINFPNFKLEDFKFSQEKKRIPLAELEMKMSIEKYGSVSGKRLFIPLNFLNKVSSVPKVIENRTANFKLSFAFHDADTIVYSIPENYKIEYKPEDVSVHTEFGEYHVNIAINKKEITYTRNRKMNKGVYPPEAYSDFIKFYKKMVKADKMKLVLVKDGI
jgi:hypothetical protein